MRGRIIRGIAGFYYVAPVPAEEDGTPQTAAGRENEAGVQRGSLPEAARGVLQEVLRPADDLYECRAKGIFRKDGKKPLPGDYVEFDITSEEEKEGNVSRILPRSSALIRPAVANVDQALIIMAAVSPQPNLNLMDRFLVTMEQQGILSDSYRASGYPVVFTSAVTGEGLPELQTLLEGRTTTVAGPSGVGKSSLINELQDGVSMQTGEISRIERGRHTTRHSELIRIRPGTWIVDTPGFSSIELYDMEKEELGDFFPEFRKWEPQCRFTGCAHINEPDCGVKEALRRGEISESRYENYCQLYAELKDRRKY